MIKLEIEIKEEDTIKLKNFNSTGVKVDLITKKLKSTQNEEIALKEIKERLEVDKKSQIINKTSFTKKKVLDELIDELFSI